ncbi:MAG TPA: tetratricopeptide repeat protein [Terriglobales bacterium]|nr:tetratricopeptide repeat protein [Terriglobales bacterium]
MRVTSPAPPGAGRSLFSSAQKRNVILGLLLILATLALYNPVVHHPFVNFDDDRYVTDNINVRGGLHWSTIKWAFTTYDEANWHPLTWISHALDCQFFGLNPAGHHYTSVLLHALNAMLLFWVLWRATGATGPSLFVAALFAVHPVNVESVAWVAERKSVLSMLFFLLALGMYQRYVRKPSVARYSGVAALYACGLMAKPMVITLPFVLLLWDYWPMTMKSRSGADQDDAPYRFFWLLLEKIPLFLLALGSSIVTVKAQKAGDAIGSMVEYPLKARLENAVVAYVRYIGKAFWPEGLSPIYPHPGSSMKMWQVAAAAMVLLTITGMVVAARKRRYLLVGWLWFLGTLVPMIGLVQVGTQAMADRYAYLPFVGLFIMVGWGVRDWAEAQHVSRGWLAGVGAVCVLGLALMAHRQIGYWGDNLTLWTHAVEVQPGSFIAQDNLGGALLNEGRYDEAMQHFRMAVAIDGTDPMSRLNIAADEQRHGHLQQAVEQFNKLVVTTKDQRYRATAFSDMGYAYLNLGDLARAKQSFGAAVSLRPRTLRAWIGLGVVAQKTGDPAAAVRAYSQALKIQQWDLGYFLLGRALQQGGKDAEAQAALDEARRLSENFDQLQKASDALLAK